jgi:hypothetical protein
LPVEFFTDPFTPLLAHLPDSTRIANISTLQGDLRKDRAGRDGQRMGPSAAGLPICLIVPGPSLQKSLLTCSFRKQSLFIMSQALHSELLLSSCQERRATVQDMGSSLEYTWGGQAKENYGLAPSLAPTLSGSEAAGAWPGSNEITRNLFSSLWTPYMA